MWNSLIFFRHFFKRIGFPNVFFEYLAVLQGFYRKKGLSRLHLNQGNL